MPRKPITPRKRKPAATKRQKDMTRRSIRLNSTTARIIVTIVQAVGAYVVAVEASGGTWQLNRAFIAGGVGAVASAVWNGVIKPALLRDGTEAGA